MKKQAKPLTATLSQSPENQQKPAESPEGSEESRPRRIWGVDPARGKRKNVSAASPSPADTQADAQEDAALPLPNMGGGDNANRDEADTDDEGVFRIFADVNAGELDDHSSQIQQRRLARRIAVQALFEIDSVGHVPGTVVDERIAYYAPGPHAAEYLRRLVSGVVRNWDALNGLIRQYAPEWPVEQLAIVDRNILRLALYEMGSQDSDVPPKAVINEAVELGKLFGSDSSPRFINGVLGSALDTVYRKLF